MIQLDAVLFGREESFGPGGQPSAIRKRLAVGPVAVTAQGLEGDCHGDRVHHGGPERAVHHYAFDHYTAWQAAYPKRSELFALPGFFGENLSTRGMTEATVCVGDIYRVGGVLLQVSEPRQPCWKLAHRADIDELALEVQKTSRTGWFYRVLEEGSIREGDGMLLADRPHPDWSLARILAALFLTPLEPSELSGVAQLPALSPGMRELAARRLSSGQVESWQRRLTIPVA